MTEYATSCCPTPGVICLVAMYEHSFTCWLKVQAFICIHVHVCVCSCLVAGMESDPLPPGSEEPPPPGMDGAVVNGGTYMHCIYTAYMYMYSSTLEKPFECVCK